MLTDIYTIIRKEWKEIFLQRGGDDLFGCLTQAGVDHFHAGVPQRARDDLGAAVVAIEAGLGDDDSQFAHVMISGQWPFVRGQSDH